MQKQFGRSSRRKPLSTLSSRRFDSILINGQLRWQSQLNGYNLPYFLSTQKFFTNYWVRFTQFGFSYDD